MGLPSKTAAIYVRVSTTGQEAEGTSLDTQETACHAYAAQRGYSVAEVYREVHTGSELWERPKLTELREAVRKGRVDAVICHALDRLSRKQAHVAIIADECERAGATLAFVTDEFERSAVGEFIRSAKAFAAELEREKIRERMQRGMRARAASGKLSKVTPPYGYRFRDESRGALEVDEANGPIMRRIFADAAGGVSLRQIEQHLNDEGVPPPGNGAKWHFASIRRMLLREEYAGVALAYKEKNTIVNGQRVRVARDESERVILPEGTIPPLVSRETFDLVRERLARNKAEAIRNHRNPERFLLRAGFICCGYCGKSIGAYCGNEFVQEGRRYRVADRYRANKHNTDCPLVWHNAAELDEAIWAKVYAALTDKAIIAREVAKRRQSDPTAEDRRATERLIADVERRRMNLVRTLADTDDADSRDLFRSELDKLGTRKRELAAEIDNLNRRYEAWQSEQANLDSLEAWCRKVAAGLENASYERKRLALTALGIRVKLYAVGHEPRWECTPLIGVETDDIVSPRSCSARHNSALVLHWTDRDSLELASD